MYLLAHVRLRMYVHMCASTCRSQKQMFRVLVIFYFIEAKPLAAPTASLLAGLASQLALGMPRPRLHVRGSQVASTSAPLLQSVMILCMRDLGR